MCAVQVTHDKHKDSERDGVTILLLHLTFQTTDPPQSRMGERPWVLFVLVVGVVLADVGCAVADEGAGIQPVVRPYGHRHQAEGGERPHGGEEDLDPLLTHHAFSREVQEGVT